MLYVEGKADRVPALRLAGLTNREVKVEGDRGKVLNRLAQENYSLAMVDEDPGQDLPGQLRRMQLVSDYPGTGLKLYTDSGRSNRVIVVCPRLEEWIIRAANDAGLQLRGPRYNLPSGPSSLHNAINDDLRKLERLIDDLLAAQSPRILRLKELLTQ